MSLGVIDYPGVRGNNVEELWNSRPPVCDTKRCGKEAKWTVRWVSCSCEKVSWLVCADCREIVENFLNTIYLRSRFAVCRICFIKIELKWTSL